MRRASGFLLIAISAVTFGVMPILARFAYASGCDATTLLFLRFTSAGLVLAAWLFIRRIPLPKGGTLWGLVGMGALGYVGQSLCYFTSLTLIPASLTALLLYLYPILVTVFAALIYKERITILKGAALLLALCGAVMVIGFSQGGNPAGIALGVAAAVIYSVYILAGTKIMRGTAALPATTVIIASAGLVYCVIAAIRGVHFPTTTGGWLSVAGLSLLSTVVAIGTFLAGLDRIGPGNAATLSTLEPVVSVLLAALLLGEHMTPVNLAGGALILLAAVLLARGEIRQQPNAKSLT
jgi:drug/metabolite transporter (DMT)-like permease